MDLIPNMSETTRIIVLTAIVLASAYVLIKVTHWLIDRSFVAASDRLKIDPTRYKFFKNTTSFIIWMIALATIVSFIPKLKTLAITLFAGAGILVAIIGFAAQAAFANIVSGVFIVLFRPLRVGDMIKVGTLDYGIVEDITLRHTVIVNFENKRIIIPNSVVSAETIINDTIEDTVICKFVEFGISYDSDVNLAMKIIQEVAEAHPLSIDHRTKKEKRDKLPVINVRVINFGDSSVNLRAYVWTNDPMTSYQMHSDINKTVKERFDREGVEMPFPYRTVVYKKDLNPNAKLADEAKE